MHKIIATLIASCQLVFAFPSQISAQDADLREELTYSIERGNLDSVRAYIEEDNIGVNALDADDNTPLATAILHESTAVAEYLIEKGADVDHVGPIYGIPIFHDACAFGNLELIKLMLRAKVDFRAVDKYGQNALEYAAMCGQEQAYDLLAKLGLESKYKIHVAAGLGDLQFLKQRTAQGLDQKNSTWKETPLHFACMAGQVEVCEFLLAQGANAKAKNVVGVTPLHFAGGAVDEESAKRLIDLLLEHGADINARDEEGTTPLDMAGDAWDYLQSKGAKEGGVQSSPPE